MVEINWTPQSLYDVKNIAEFIAKDSVKYANIQVERFFDIIKILNSHPKAGKIVPEISDEKIRELIHGNYRIIYRIVNKNQIDIITVHHSKRLLSNNPALYPDN